MKLIYEKISFYSSSDKHKNRIKKGKLQFFRHYFETLMKGKGVPLRPTYLCPMSTQNVLEKEKEIHRKRDTEKRKRVPKKQDIEQTERGEERNKERHRE